MNSILVTEYPHSPDNPNIDVLPDDSSPVGIILAIAILIGAISKLLKVLIPVMTKDQMTKDH